MKEKILYSLLIIGLIAFWAWCMSEVSYKLF
jgi:hypothetical protein